VPFVEFLIRSQPDKQFFYDAFYEPIGGSVALPDRPGLGLVLEEAKIERREQVKFG
jgi:L-alanine-DL-glutamate epimerase-like enolase superfamily enzyme